MAKVFHIEDDNPAEKILQNLTNYFPGGLWEFNRIRNRNARILGFNPWDSENKIKVDQFIKHISTQFEHIIISEHHDESMIVMRRKLCWEISDIIYLPLNIRNYTYKSAPMDQTLIEKLWNWSKVDFLLYNIFNKTLWKEVSGYGQEFWNELEFYLLQKKKIYEFCKPVLSVIQHNTNEVRELLDLNYYMILPKSPWGSEYKIDYIWCLMSKIDSIVLRNFIRINEYPELCDNINMMYSHIPLRFFQKSRSSPEVRINPDYCSHNRTSVNSTFQIPIPVLLNSTIYCSLMRPASRTITCWHTYVVTRVVST